MNTLPTHLRSLSLSTAGPAFKYFSVTVLHKNSLVYKTGIIFNIKYRRVDETIEKICKNIPYIITQTHFEE